MTQQIYVNWKSFPLKIALNLPDPLPGWNYNTTHAPPQEIKQPPLINVSLGAGLGGGLKVGVKGGPYTAILGVFFQSIAYDAITGQAYQGPLQSTYIETITLPFGAGNVNFTVNIQVTEGKLYINIDSDRNDVVIAASEVDLDQYGFPISNNYGRGWFDVTISGWFNNSWKGNGDLFPVYPNDTLLPPNWTPILYNHDREIVSLGNPVWQFQWVSSSSFPNPYYIENNDFSPPQLSCTLFIPSNLFPYDPDNLNSVNKYRYRIPIGCINYCIPLIKQGK